MKLRKEELYSMEVEVEVRRNSFEKRQFLMLHCIDIALYVEKQKTKLKENETQNILNQVEVYEMKQEIAALQVSFKKSISTFSTVFS